MSEEIFLLKLEPRNLGPQVTYGPSLHTNIHKKNIKEYKHTTKESHQTTKEERNKEELQKEIENN